MRLFRILLFITVCLIVVDGDGFRIRGGNLEVWDGFRWISCNCNGKATRCFYDKALFERTGDGGHCLDCRDNADGPNCERCKPNHFKNNRGLCVRCGPDSGFRCDICTDGYYGDPEGKFGSPRPCHKCECNGNVDPNALGNCDPVTGECLKCIYNTHGRYCDQCLPGFYGNPKAIPKGNCRPCGCHPRGTRIAESKSSHRQGGVSSLCNQGQCDCKRYVVGRQCDRCADGYWNFDSGNGCEPCNCNPLGSVSRSCDQQTGRCPCKPGVTGDKCDQCVPLHFGPTEMGCPPCDCDRTGSISLQCDDYGQCPCRENIGGFRCERCPENKYNMSAGCIDCPPCYNLVQDAVTVFRLKLGEVTRVLIEIEETPIVVEDKNFIVQLEEFMRKVDDLLREVKKSQTSEESLIREMEQLKLRIRKVFDVASQVRGRLGPIETTVNFGNSNVSLAIDIIERARSALANARRILDHEGLPALTKARERSKKYGQQSERMSEIARLAIGLADSHEKDARHIQVTLIDALNTSRHAYEVAKDAVDTQEANRMRIEKLRQQLEEMNEKLQRTKTTVVEAKRVAQSALNDAVELFSDLESFNNTLPKVEADRIKQEAMELIIQAKRISREADELLLKHSELLNKTKTDLTDAGDLLEEAMRQQQITDALLSEIDLALNMAEGAVASGEATVREANKTLITLREFYELVRISREKAKEPLRTFQKIKTLKTEAEEKTNDAEAALQGALQDAIEALQVAENAKDIAEKASLDAKRIKGETSKTKEKASKLKAEAKSLFDDMIATSERMKEYEEQAANDDKLAKDVLEMASQAKTSTLDARRKVTKGTKTLDDILDALENLDNIDSLSLDLLEKRLAAAEQELIDANLEDRTALLQKERNLQSQRMRNYDDEIAKLRLDVANVKEIREAIPKTCFRSSKLEP